MEVEERPFAGITTEVLQVQFGFLDFRVFGVDSLLSLSLSLSLSFPSLGIAFLVGAL